MKSHWAAFSNSLLIFFLLAGESFGQFEDYGQKNCAVFQCPKDENPVPKSPLELQSSGCSSIGGGGLSMNFNGNANSGEMEISSCCDSFHACNQICGTTKSFCEDSFTKCMDAKCKMSSQKDECTKAASTKKLMLQLSNCNDFNEGQKKSCTCVKTDDADAKRKEVIEDFYQTYNPSQMSKVDGLAAKATDTNKLAGLLTKLVTKYGSKAIKKVKDSRENLMEDMMNGRGPNGIPGMGRKAFDADRFENDQEEAEEEEMIEL